jgi:hypothetical protein
LLLKDLKPEPQNKALQKTACLLPQTPAAADVDGGGIITKMYSIFE